MKRKFIAAAAFAAILSCAAKDEVVMTVNGVDVPRSEFEYLYHKNRQQQVDPQTLEEYAEMFKIYKLKVADALNMRIDTLPEFRKEMKQYQSELAKPYMTDSVYLNSLVKDAYDRSREEVEAIHIMIGKGRTPADQVAARSKADSIRTAILKGADFADMARRYSDDRNSRDNGGRMSFISTGHLPYGFEKTVFSLRPGEISDVVESPHAFHIIKGGKRRPARGKVSVEHIMKAIPKNMTPEQAAAATAAIDSIYQVVKADPSKFEELARQLSDDTNSGRNGGKIGWFDAGMMVEPFDSAAFALAVDEISRPVRSQYGWHIIHKLDAKAPESLEEMKPGILNRIQNPQDERSKMVRDNLVAKIEKRLKGSLNHPNIRMITSRIESEGLDSAMWASLTSSSDLGATEVARIGKSPISIADVLSPLGQPAFDDNAFAAEQVKKMIELSYGNKLIEAEEERLYAEQPDYHNLMKEYREGSLLYEASVRRVWDKASKDTEGLEEYFRKHRDNYTWKRPHVKGILIQAADDSVANLMRERLAALDPDLAVKTIRREFSGKASADRVLAEQGQNGMVDNIMFGGAPVKPSNKNFSVYFIWEPKLLDAPESVADVKGIVTSDYQNQLEADWVEELKAKYPVTVNSKVLKKVK